MANSQKKKVRFEVSQSEVLYTLLKRTAEYSVGYMAAIEGWLWHSIEKNVATHTVDGDTKSNNNMARCLVKQAALLIK